MYQSPFFASSRQLAYKVHIFKEAVLSIGGDGVENVYQSPFFDPIFANFLTSSLRR